MSRTSVKNSFFAPAIGRHEADALLTLQGDGFIFSGRHEADALLTLQGDGFIFSGRHEADALLTLLGLFGWRDAP